MDNINFEHHYQIMREILWSDKFTGDVVGRIRWRIEQIMVLTEFVDYTESKTKLEFLRSRVKDFVLSDVWAKYVNRKPYLKYTDEYTLSTYLCHYMDYEMYHVLKRYIPADKKNCNRWRGDYMEERYKNMRGEFGDHLEGSGNPLDELEKKEFCVIARKHLKDVDFEVLEGRASREEAAEELSISYEAYKKGLQRRMAKLEAEYGKGS